MCAAWIPEIYIADIKEYPTKLTINRLDKKRFRLKCGLCSGKGACVECKHGKCRTAAHPWCVVNTPGGYTRRVVKDEDDELIWQIFCKTHASSVSDPLKPKPKNKIVQQLAAVAIIGTDAINKSKEKMKKHDRESALPRLSMAHSIKKTKVIETSSNKNVKKNIIEILHASGDGATGSKGIGVGGKSNQINFNTTANVLSGEKTIGKKIDGVSLSAKKSRGPYKKKGAINSSSTLEDDSDNENGNGHVDDGNATSRGEDNHMNDDSEQIIKPRISNGHKSVNLETDSRKSEEERERDDGPIDYSILTLNEWPGQSEGEAMDLDHFWNVAAMQYPEDHPPAVSSSEF